MKKSKLEQLKKPEPKKFDVMGLEDSDADAVNELEGESEGEGGAPKEFAGEESKPEEMAELEKVSDDDLLAELKRRGLSAKAEKAPEDSSSEDDSYFE